jgi:hypothetical protein
MCPEPPDNYLGIFRCSAGHDADCDRLQKIPQAFGARSVARFPGEVDEY